MGKQVKRYFFRAEARRAQRKTGDCDGSCYFLCEAVGGWIMDAQTAAIPEGGHFPALHGRNTVAFDQVHEGPAPFVGHIGVIGPLSWAPNEIQTSARRIRNNSRVSFFRVSSCSHMRRTRQPFWHNACVTKQSRDLLRANLETQYATRDCGV